MQSSIQSPYFSVVIPTYNRGHLVLKAIQSVLDQTFLGFEIIIVDDGSEDDTSTIVSTIDDSRIIYIYQENGERGKARNQGTASAKGKYVFFLDSDDKIESTYLQHAYEYLIENKEPEFFHIRYKEIIGDSEYPSHLLNKKTLLNAIKRQNQFACQFFLRRDIALSIPFSENRDLKIGEDWQVILQIAVRYPLHFSNAYLGRIIHGDRSMEAPTVDTVLTSKKLLLETLVQDKLITADILKNITVEFTFLASLSASLTGKRKLALKHWFSAFKIRPSILFKRRTLAIFKHLLFSNK